MADIQDVLDALTAELRRLGRIIRDISGDGITNGPNGITISAVRSSGNLAVYRQLVVPVNLTDVETGGGYYKGVILTRTLDPVAGATSDLSMPAGLAGSGGTSNILVLNPADDVHSHVLQPGICGAVLLAGFTTETPPRQQGIWLSGSPRLIPVSLSQSGGADGTSTTPASWTYNARDASTADNVIGSGALTVAMNRPNGKTNKATHGTVRNKADGTWEIWWCDEVPTTSPCS